MKKLPVRLHDLQKPAEVFHTPEGYFDTLPQRIQKKTSRSSPTALWQHYLLRYALPAMVLLVAVVSVYLLRTPATAPADALANVSDEAIKQYLMQSGVHEHELLDFYSSNADKLEIPEMELDIPREAIEKELEIEQTEDFL